MRPSTLAIVFGAGRALIGVALLAVPAPIARSWVGADGRAAALLTRSLGARDLVIGAGLVVAVQHDHDPRSWLVGSVLCDAVDATVTWAAGDQIPRNGRVATTTLAAGSALFGAWLASAID
jgi:hypothetical protein